MKQYYHDEAKESALISLITLAITMVAIISITYIQSQEHISKMNQIEQEYQSEIEVLKDVIIELEEENKNLNIYIEELEEELPK